MCRGVGASPFGPIAAAVSAVIPIFGIDRLDTAAVKGQALDLCQELFVADGARSEEEDAVLQNLRKLLE